MTNVISQKKFQGATQFLPKPVTKKSYDYYPISIMEKIQNLMFELPLKNSSNAEIIFSRWMGKKREYMSCTLFRNMRFIPVVMTKRSASKFVITFIEQSKRLLYIPKVRQILM